MQNFCIIVRMECSERIISQQCNIMISSVDVCPQLARENAPSQFHWTVATKIFNPQLCNFIGQRK